MDGQMRWLQTSSRADPMEHNGTGQFGPERVSPDNDVDRQRSEIARVAPARGPQEAFRIPRPGGDL